MRAVVILAGRHVAARAVEVNMQGRLLIRFGLVPSHADKIGAALPRVVVTLRMRRIVREHRHGPLVVPEREHPHIGVDHSLRRRPTIFGSLLALMRSFFTLPSSPRMRRLDATFSTSPFP